MCVCVCACECVCIYRPSVMFHIPSLSSYPAAPPAQSRFHLCMWRSSIGSDSGDEGLNQTKQALGCFHY